MASRESLKTALDETRLLILGSQILFGFEFNGLFQDSFTELSSAARYLSAAGFLLMATAIALLITPSLQHRLVEGGSDSLRIHRVTTLCAALALVPFAISIGLNFFIVLEHHAGTGAAASAATTFFLLAILFWFGIEHFIRSAEKPMSKNNKPQKVSLDMRIEHMLTEARVLLPGAQALLGFQFAIMLAKSFEQLPDSSKLVHMAALGLIALTVILLMTPAAIHRISFRGEDTERFHRIGSGFVVVAAVPLGLGIGADTYVAITRATESSKAGVVAAAAIVSLLATLWFIQPLLLRAWRATGP
jgi:hypothetical protein